LLINGNLEIWQRGISQTNASYGSADRWFFQNTGTTKVISQFAFPLGSTDVDNNPKYYVRHQVTSVAGAANNCNYHQRIKGVNRLSGQTITLSFWANANVAANISVEYRQIFGTGGTPSATIDGIGVKKFQIGTTWKKYVITTTIPSCAGKVLGTDNNDATWLTIWFDAGSNFNARTDSLGQQSGTFRTAQHKLEIGSVATPYQFQSESDVLAECQAYYWKGYMGGRAFNFSAYAVGCFSCWMILFPRKMIGVPTVTVDAATVTNCNQPTYTSTTEDGFRLLCSSTAVNVNCGFTYTATQFAYADAEM
jgi:hypothetical protein